MRAAVATECGQMGLVMGSALDIHVVSYQAAPHLRLIADLPLTNAVRY